MRTTRLFSAAAFACAFTLPVSTLDLTKISDEEREIFHEKVRAYLMNNPQVVMDTVAQLEARQQQQAAEADLNLSER